jgi:pyrroline-5-carboxylate reductase
MQITISCIGSGNMGTALMQAAAAIVGPGTIGFTDVDTAKAKAAAAKINGRTFSSNIEAVQAADYIFLAVKPQIYSIVLEEIAPALKERVSAGQGHEKTPVLISMAPGWTVEKVQSCLGVKVPVARIMPNTPALISKGLIALCLSPEVTADDAAGLEKILQGSGLVETLEEKYFDAVTGLSGSGPAFVYLFIEALADGGVRAGLPRDKALRYAAQTVLGSATMVLETGKHPGELKDMVTSPGGTTIAGVAALEKGAFRGTVISAVEAAWQRAVELG